MKQFKARYQFVSLICDNQQGTVVAKYLDRYYREHVAVKKILNFSE
jgi:hypothetical protein